MKQNQTETTKATLSEKLKRYRISPAEYEKMKELLGREPKAIEWPLFSALWSEHCSYKSSKVHLKKFAKTLNSTVVSAAGENAGVVDLGHGERIAFKMESHNHPSFIEPYQGAATGVGGILRDIFTMGARPIAIADALCFGDPQAPKMPALMDGVVRGISGYGNCVGVPTVTGQTHFSSSYNQNILVNAMAVGLFRQGEPIALSGAQGVGNWVVYVGAKTGKDGVHGAAMASESFDDNSESKKPNVQIGDPYFEKLLIESCLEVIQAGLVVSIQDMGAAGLTSSSFEMASKGQLGMTLDLSQVPLRDSSMTPEEILLSESQERMLLVCEPQKFAQIEKHFSRWGLDAKKVGEVLAERKVQLLWKGDLLTEVDPDLLVENAPQYQRPFEIWSEPRKVSKAALKTNRAQHLAETQNLKSFLQKQLSHVDHAQRSPIYRQYDQRVGGSTAHGSDYDIAFLRLPDSGRGLAIGVGCRPKLMAIDARLGALDSVFYPALQMSVKGAKVCAVTDCLNFGNPEKLEIMSEFVASVEAIQQASLSLQAPVISGNVSFYNETMGVSIVSTPTTGLIGLRDHVENLPDDQFEQAGSAVALIRFHGPELCDKHFSGELDVPALTKFLEAIQTIVGEQDILSSQVVGFGGLALALAKMSGQGFGIVTDSSFNLDEAQAPSWWTEENLYQVILEVKDFSKLFQSWKKISDKLHLSAKSDLHDIGRTSENHFQIGSWIQSDLTDPLFQPSRMLETYFQGVKV